MGGYILLEAVKEGTEGIGKFRRRRVASVTEHGNVQRRNKIESVARAVGKVKGDPEGPDLPLCLPDLLILLVAQLGGHALRQHLHELLCLLLRKLCQQAVAAVVKDRDRLNVAREPGQGKIRGRVQLCSVGERDALADAITAVVFHRHPELRVVLLQFIHRAAQRVGGGKVLARVGLRVGRNVIGERAHRVAQQFGGDLIGSAVLQKLVAHAVPVHEAAHTVRRIRCRGGLHDRFGLRRQDEAPRGKSRRPQQAQAGGDRRPPLPGEPDRLVCALRPGRPGNKAIVHIMQCV